MRFEADWSRPPTPLAVRPRRVERPAGDETVAAPIAWPSARVEAWLDWGDTLPDDYPPGDLPAILNDTLAFDPLLNGGPARHARRLAAWGWSLGLFDTAEDAIGFAQALFGLYASGLATPGPSLAFGARLHPLARDPARAPQSRPSNIDSPDSWRASATDMLSMRLAAVSEAVRRCAGDPVACADPAENQVLARVAWAARDAGANDAQIADATTGR